MADPTFIALPVAASAYAFENFDQALTHVVPTVEIKIARLTR